MAPRHDPLPDPLTAGLRRVADRRLRRRTHREDANLPDNAPAIGTVRRAVLQRIAYLDPGGGLYKPLVSDRLRFRAWVIATYGPEVWRDYAAVWGYREVSGMPK